MRNNSYEKRQKAHAARQSTATQPTNLRSSSLGPVSATRASRHVSRATALAVQIYDKFISFISNPEQHSEPHEGKITTHSLVTRTFLQERPAHDDLLPPRRGLLHSVPLRIYALLAQRLKILRQARPEREALCRLVAWVRCEDLRTIQFRSHIGFWSPPRSQHDREWLMSSMKPTDFTPRAPSSLPTM